MAKRRSRKSDDDESLFNADLRGKDRGGDSNGRAGRANASGGGGGGGDVGIALHEAAQSRYLNYSLSVITSRALPDVRDGLKPVQRRILYTMWQQGLRAEAKPRKSATVCGTVMGSYHPHGDSAIYDALVRMAQSWVMRVPLVEGIGNFGSIDGDNPAAYRYTECRLAPPATALLDDIGQNTVPYRPNYDGTKTEPVVLPSKLPNLLVNGSSGIAVGMATNIPPHNLTEVVKACLKLLADPEIKDYQLVANDAVQGPDFPTGGQIINSRDELREIYKTGSGSVKVRGTTQIQKSGNTRNTKTLQITSIPYSVNKANLVEQIAQIVIDRKMPLLLDVSDFSADDLRIDLELKKDADEAKVLAYLYKHTALQTNFNVNLTCLVPTQNPEVGAPDRLGLKEILWHFLHFRLDVVTRRLENELAGLEKRIHILEGFALIFDALDEIIKIIRVSAGKADAAVKIMKRFPAASGGLDAEQTEAILELKLYRLARLEINLVNDELKAKKKRAREIKKLLNEDVSDTTKSGRWGIVREELNQIIADYGKSKEAKRRTVIEAVGDEPEFSAEDFIVAEDCHVLVTADGWVKRQKEIKEPQKSRIREGDRVLACVAASTRTTIGFFSSLGTCYTARGIDIPASTGYGEPIQKLFKLKDGEKIVAVMSFDEHFIDGGLASLAEDPKKPDECPWVHGFAATSDGYSLRFGLAGFTEPSTRSGRRFGRPAKGHAVVGFTPVHGSETILAVSADCRAMVCRADEVNYLSGPGKGVQLIKLGPLDKLLGFKASEGDRDLLNVETNRGAKKTISTVKYRTTARGGKGTEIQKNGKIARILPDEVPAPPAFA
ncbi:MAG: DNA topoisomerase (ATP-hydrolyzing) [Planctomycetota bacterium]